MSNGAASVLDYPVEQVPHPQELVEAAMEWHFSPETGSPYWLERAKSLAFDPRRDVHSLTDLRMFPDTTDELRHVRAEDLIPKGYGSRDALIGVYESGGTTGAPKRVVLLADWLERWMAWSVQAARLRGYPQGANWLTIVPTGPHVLGYFAKDWCRRLGGIPFAIDLDPRWAKKLASEGQIDQTDRYAEHLIAQCEYILETQDIGVITATPPLLERLSQHDRLLNLINANVKVISWGGVHMDADTRHILRTEVFPNALIHGAYGSTIALGGSLERIGLTDDEPCIFDPFYPYISFAVVNPETGQDVPYGERGMVVMNHISKSMLIPNNHERDVATRMPPQLGQFGDSVADVMPVRAVDGKLVVEGVY